jgi:2-hydroxycyclohexanecarboxyl-CoA dehydrogenase
MAGVSAPGPPHAVITGAASPRGIGRATADRLARDGWSIGILDLDGEAAKRTATEIGGDRSVASPPTSSIRTRWS